MLDAIKWAKGEYIAIQGSGDVSYAKRLEYQKNFLDENPDVGIVGSHYENFVETSGVCRLRTPDANTATVQSLIKKNVFTHGEVMFRKEVYEKAGGYRAEFIFCQDYDLWLRMSNHCRFGTVPKLLYRRHVDFDGVSYKPEKFIAQTRYMIIASAYHKYNKPRFLRN